MSNLLMRKSTVQAGGPSILAAPFPPPFPVKSSGLSRWLRALPSGLADWSCLGAAPRKRCSFWAQHAAARENDCTLDHILEFSCLDGPGMRQLQVRRDAPPRAGSQGRRLTAESSP